jgi:hypothetical protein
MADWIVVSLPNAGPSTPLKYASLRMTRQFLIGALETVHQRQKQERRAPTQRVPRRPGGAPAVMGGADAAGVATCGGQTPLTRHGGGR